MNCLCVLVGGSDEQHQGKRKEAESVSQSEQSTSRQVV